ncbi:MULTISPECIES: histidine phosphatase family protein [Protofrankia]|uniref:Phosphoglycerate mutase n=1 Tax=Candidatus Protofrankia datiscae TaxID=2716812 RepID=F8B631_9ACTN|nr:MULTISPECIES: histidine phosphatase family protein [Protofrankia]AEH10182.1 Phosphoglycerate mutase [Candidatus Protofrankia datiscae]
MSAGGPLRLTLVSHARTAAVRAARFGVDDDTIDDAEARRAAAVTTSHMTHTSGASRTPSGRALRGGRAWCDRSLRTRQTAQALGLSAMPDPALRDLDVGAWVGRSLDEISPADLRLWTEDPAAAPHGGESVVDLLDRVAAWLAARATDPENVIAVTHPAVVRAALVTALRSPPEVFWRIDVPPLSATLLHGRLPATSTSPGHAGGKAGTGSMVWTLRHACLSL